MTIHQLQKGEVIGFFRLDVIDIRSLLSVSTEHGVALHYDSLNGCNEGEARATTQKLASLLKARTISSH